MVFEISMMHILGFIVGIAISLVFIFLLEKGTFTRLKGRFLKRFVKKDNP